MFLVSNFEVNNFRFLYYVAFPFFILSLIPAIILLFSVRTEPRYVNLDIPSNLYSPIFNSCIVFLFLVKCIYFVFVSFTFSPNLIDSLSRTSNVCMRPFFALAAKNPSPQKKSDYEKLPRDVRMR